MKPSPRPRPVPPGSVAAKGVGMKRPGPQDPMRTGSLKAMQEQAMRKAATDFSYKYADTASSPPPPFAGFGWEEVRNPDESTNTGEFVPR